MTNNKSKNEHLKNPWTPEDEGDHYPSMKEWWCIQTLFKTLDDNRKWNLKSSFAYELERPSCFFLCHIFDMTSKKLVFKKTINDNIEKLSLKKNIVDIKYENNSLKGLFPNYKIQINQEEKDIFADFTYKAKNPPHWSAQDISDGYLPFGLDYYRYGWLLNCDLTGTLKIKGKSHKIKGTGYLEKAWGNWSYTNPFQKLSGFRRAFSTYGNLLYWWLSNRKPKIYNRIEFTTDNNPFGYDWFWGIFDNDWSIFYGNALFWVSEGPAFGVLTLFKEGNEYIDFCNIYAHYNKCEYVKEYDLYYPVDINLSAVKDDKKIKIRAYPTCEIYPYVEKFEGDKFYRAFALPEIPGRVEGIYTDDENQVELKGDCKIEPQRQPSKLGHNSIKLDFLKPPKGFGLNVDFKFNYLKKKGSTKLHLIPRPKISFKIDNIFENKPNEKKK